jgi:hypothetical protein
MMIGEYVPTAGAYVYFKEKIPMEEKDYWFY